MCFLWTNSEITVEQIWVPSFALGLGLKVLQIFLHLVSKMNTGKVIYAYLYHGELVEYFEYLCFRDIENNQNVATQ